MDIKTKALLAASVVGLLAAASAVSAHEGDVPGAAAGDKPCYGVNKCKGTGDCGGKGHGCAGKNECKAQGYIDMAEEDCLRIEGGRLTPDAA